MTENEARAIRTEAAILRSLAKRNRVANQVATRLIALTGGEEVAAKQFSEERDRILAVVTRRENEAIASIRTSLRMGD
jgi:hypothetical protein